MKVNLSLPIAPTLNRIWTLHVSPQLGYIGNKMTLISLRQYRQVCGRPHNERPGFHCFWKESRLQM